MWESEQHIIMTSNIISSQRRPFLSGLLVEVAQ